MLENLTNLFMFLGGIGMFLYGMNLMADGMQKSAGSKMKNLLNMLTGNRVVGILVGALITAIIQSSGATTVMVVGFVSSGLMTLSQAIGVIMGANIGTTITAWIVSLSQIGDEMKMLNPEFYAPVLIAIGAAITMFSKGQRKHNIAEIILGIGFLFEGLKFMSESVSVYTDAPIFATVFTTLGRNPLLGVLAGAAITALLQSSSVSVGILQTLAVNGMVETNAAVFITLGENIGSCVTAMLSAVGGNRNAKRAAIMHLSFNVIGAVLFGTIGFIVFALFPDIAHHRITPVEISIFHTGFKTAMTIILFPFAEKIVALSGVIVPEKREKKAAEEKVTRLDPRIFEQPSIAVAALGNEVSEMGRMALENVNRACAVCFSRDEDEIRKVFELEDRINRMNKELSEYLIHANTLSLTDHQKLIIADLFNSLTDIERTGDHAENITEQVQMLIDRNLYFSGTGQADLRDITNAVQEAFKNAVEARAQGSLTHARNVSIYEDKVDTLRDDQKERHMQRLSSGECDPAAGIIFIEIIDNLERISDHAENIAEYIAQESQ